MIPPTFTTPPECFRARMVNLRHHWVSTIAVLSITTALLGCGGKASGDPDSPRILTTKEAQKLLLQLPYKYQFREVELPEGASGALAGKAFGSHHTVVSFGISLGAEPEPVPVPQAGVRGAYYYWGGGLVFTDNLVVAGGAPKGMRTKAQWHEAVDMVIEMQDKLCEASTGEFCPAV